MKNLLTYIIFLIFIFKGIAAAQEISQLPDDFKGLNFRARQAELSLDSEAPADTFNTLTAMYEVGNYFNNKYPNNEIFEEDFYEELRPFFPNTDDKTLERYTNYLQNGIRIYRIGKSIYNKYVSNLLMPKSYRRVHTDEDFDRPNETPYIDAGNEKFIKIYNPKKFLSYSNNPEERRAIDDYKNATKKDSDPIAKFEYIIKNYSWKQLFSYGSANPLVSNAGKGETVIGSHVDVQLLSPSSYIDEQKELIVGLRIFPRDNYFVLANDLSPMQKKPSVTLENSANVENYKIVYPAPLNTASLPYVHKYFGDFIIPIYITVQDTQKPLFIEAQTQLTVCNGFMKCHTQDFDLSLEIKPHGSLLLSNGLENFFYNNEKILPREKAQNFELKKFVVDEDNDGPALRLEFWTDTDIENFKVFVEDVTGYTKFNTPAISIQDNKIYVRIRPMSGESILSFKDADFIITAVLNNTDAYRSIQKARQASLFDYQSTALNLGLIALAVLGGFILNFMPCVFPVLSLKIISLSRATAGKRRYLQKSLLLTAAGIFCGFTVLIFFLLTAKYFGYSLGWGMQYQNMNFLVIMTFILAVLTAIFPQLQTSDLQKLSNRSDHKFNFILGNLIVLLSTPCTGPYLATAIGFALSGSYLDIITILYAVALGLSSPYLLALCFKNPEDLLPKPGAWLNKLSMLMKAMLYLTILWFLSLILSQTDLLCVFLFLLLLLLFILLFLLYRKFNDYLNLAFHESVSLETLFRLRKISTFIMLTVFILFLSLSSLLVNNSYKRHLEEKLQNRQTFIDKKIIYEKLSQGHPVLLEVSADWCLTCRYNNITTLNNINLKQWEKSYSLEFIQVDWTNYNKEILKFMEKYGRKGLPFYILYTPLMRDGIVLPEIFSSKDFEALLLNTGRR